MRKPQKRVKITWEDVTPSFEAIRFGVLLNLHKNHFQKRLLCNSYIIITNGSSNNLLHHKLHYYVVMAIKVYRLSVFESSGVMKTMTF
jgi:hypothetical protein